MVVEDDQIPDDHPPFRIARVSPSRAMSFDHSLLDISP
jgi:hypothetical protein